MRFDVEEFLAERGPEMLHTMAVIRNFESRLTSYLEAGHIRGSTHPAVGMEAVAAGMCSALRTSDVIASTHRGHAHCLAKGADPGRLLAEIFGRSTGYCGGKGRSMHVASSEHGILGTNGIVGASTGIATGAALAFTPDGSDRVATAFFGDGALNQGIVHEVMNLASVWALPCVFVCENNHFAQSARISDMVNVDRLAVRADAYGIPALEVDGMDVVAVAEAATAAVARARSGGGPTLVVADVWRYRGHMVGDTEIYRSAEETAPWLDRDPIRQLAGLLTDRAGPAAGDLLQRALDSAQITVDAAEAAALGAPEPATATALTDVYGGHGDA